MLKAFFRRNADSAQCWRSPIRLQSCLVFLTSVAMGSAAIAAHASSPKLNYDWHNAKIVAGGFITGVVADPKTPGTMYLRTDIGGAYKIEKSTGGRWVPLTDIFNQSDWNLGGTESIAVDPVDPQRVYLAQGDYTETWAGNGAILCSQNSGKTFTRVDLPIQLGSNEPGRYSGERLAVNPRHHNEIWFGSRKNGLWRSSDFGKTWAQVTSFPVTGPTSGVGVIFVDFQPTTNPPLMQTIYVGVSDTATGLYSSTDGGKTWSAVPGQPTGYYPTNRALSPDGNLYISYGDGTGADGMGGQRIGNGAVWKYNIASGVWTDITPRGPWWSTSLWYGFGAVSVDRQHPSTVMVSTLDRWWPGDEVYRSLDGGTTWLALGSEPSGSEAGPPYNYSDRNDALSPYLSGLSNPSSCNATSCDLTAASFGWWIGALLIDPFDSNHVLYGTGATLWETRDVTNADTQQMVDWTVGANGIEETAVSALISPPKGVNLISGLGDIGGFRHVSLGTSPAAGMSQPIFTPSSIDFAEKAGWVVVRVGGNNGAYSFDNGITWTSFTPPSGLNKIAISANGKSWVATPYSGTAMYSTNNGATWSAVSGVPAGDPVISDRSNPMKFYAFDSTTGTVYVSGDGGMTFAAAATGLPGGTLSASAAAEGDLWLATNTGLYHSNNAGASFNPIGSAQSVYVLGFGKAAPWSSNLTLYMSGQVNGVQGIFRSTDGGVNWTRINDDAHQWGWISVVIGDPRVFGRVYMATNGRGIIYGNDPTSPDK